MLPQSYLGSAWGARLTCAKATDAPTEKASQRSDAYFAAAARPNDPLAVACRVGPGQRGEPGNTSRAVERVLTGRQQYGLACRCHARLVTTAPPPKPDATVIVETGRAA
jgi:hypothetical protein